MKGNYGNFRAELFLREQPERLLWEFLEACCQLINGFFLLQRPQKMKRPSVIPTIKLIVMGFVP